MNVATFPKASLTAQLVELERELRDRRDRRDQVDMSSRRANQNEVDHRNNALTGAVATLQLLEAAHARGEPGRKEIIDMLRRSRARLDGVTTPDFLAEIDALLNKVPK